MSGMIPPSLGWHSSLIEGDITAVHKFYEHGGSESTREPDE